MKCSFPRTAIATSTATVSLLAGFLLIGLDTAHAADNGRSHSVGTKTRHVRTKAPTPAQWHAKWSKGGYEGDQDIVRLVADVEAGGQDRRIAAFREGYDQPQFYLLYKPFGQNTVQLQNRATGKQYSLDDSTFMELRTSSPDLIPVSSLSGIHAKNDT